MVAFDKHPKEKNAVGVHAAKCAFCKAARRGPRDVADPKARDAGWVNSLVNQVANAVVLLQGRLSQLLTPSYTQ